MIRDNPSELLRANNTGLIRQDASSVADVIRGLTVDNGEIARTPTRLKHVPVAYSDRNTAAQIRDPQFHELSYF